MRILPAFVCLYLLFSALILSSSAHAQGTAPKKSTTATPASLTSSKEQVEGICTRIVDHLWEYTDKYFHDGDYNRIVSLCRVIVEAEPSFDEAYENAAYLLWSQNDSDAADRFLEYGLQHSKDQLSLLFEFGRHLLTTERPQAALPYLQRASKMPNAGPVVFVQLGHCYEKLKKYQEAVDTFSTLVKRFPDFPSGAFNLARAKKLLASGK